MDLVGVQFDIVWEDKTANYGQVKTLLAGASFRPGSLIVLPELFATGFSMNVATIAEQAGGPTEHFLAELAVEHACFVLGGAAGRSPDGRGRNEAVIIGPDGREAARYRKLHPFTYAGEADCYAAGDRVVLFEWGGFIATATICYDLRFPELFRAAAAGGANLFVVIANWPASRHGHWSALLTARAIENQAYVLGLNRCGRDPHHAYAGGSVILDPRGNVVSEAEDGPCVVTATPDPAALQAYRREFPVLRDMRRPFDVDVLPPSSPPPRR